MASCLRQGTHFSVLQSPYLSVLCYIQPHCLPYSTCLRPEDRKRSLLLFTTELASFVQRSQEGDGKFCEGRHSLCPFSIVALASNIYPVLRIFLGQLAGWLAGEILGSILEKRNIRNYWLVYVAQEKYGGSIAQPQKGLSAHTVSTVLKILSSEEERSK